MSQKSKDDKNRFRSKTVAFRVSPEEWDQIETAVSLSGLTKQNYIMCRLSNKDIIVQGNPRIYKALRTQLSNVLEQLERISDGVVDSDLLDTINLIAITLDGLNKEQSNVYI